MAVNLGKRSLIRGFENNLRRPQIHLSEINGVEKLLNSLFNSGSSSYIFYLTSPIPLSSRDVICFDNLVGDTLSQYNVEKGWEKDPALIHKCKKCSGHYNMWSQEDHLHSNCYLLDNHKKGKYCKGLTFRAKGRDGFTGILSVATEIQLTSKFIEEHSFHINYIIEKCCDSIWKLGFGNSKHNKKNIELSSREIQVIRLAADGYTSEQSASKLFVTKSTINFHFKRIISKLDCCNKTQAVAKAIILNLV